MIDTENARLHILIDGRVQGVGFRYFVVEKALPLQVIGWVRNTTEGLVEIMAEGSRQNLERFLEAVRTGPRAAYVTSVEQEWQKPTGEFRRFDVRMTG